MDFRILEFMVVLVFAEWIWSLPLACLYNGMSHKEGEIVSTDEPCLSCVCQSGVLECSLRVCVEYPSVLPPGCFLFHKPNHCCLQIFCDENYSPIGIELQTNFKSENKLHENDCIINGNIYGDGSAVASLQPCEYCYCVEGEIKCIKPRCPHPFEGCKAVYETSSCCPMHYDCRESNISSIKSQIKNFVIADMNVTVSNDSLQSHYNLDLESKKGNLNTTESTEADLTKTEGKQIEDSTTMITEERNPEETTDISVQKSKIPVVEDSLTTLGFQITKPENFSKETGIIAFAADFTYNNVSSSIRGITKEAPEVLMQSTLGSFKGIESSLVSYDGSGDNASQEIVDYDSYDYNESQLPPSLPNLVIFPFVAADAVVKSESTVGPNSYDKDQIGKTNSHHIFYKDYFSPPIKSEGGFIPKKPSKSEESFYEHAYLSKEQIEMPNEDMRENAVAASQTNFFPQGPKEMNFSAFVDNKGTEATTADRLENGLNVTVDPSFEDIIYSDSKTASGFLLRDDDETTTNQSKKPVTVTFKNFVVDFYPNYLITTSKRVQSENETQTTAGESFRLITQKPQNEVFALDATSDPSISAPSEAKRESPMIISVNSAGGEPFSFNKFMHSFLPEATSKTTTSMTSTSKNHKFSSKITNQSISTVDIANLSTESYSALSEGFIESFSIADKLKNYSEKQKPVKAEDITRFIETKNKKVELSLSGENPSSISRKPGIAATLNGNKCLTPNAGALLKLAGCNIYGMMYRVGKVITELSGPCLECLCTDLGVQCKPLEC